ncbi:Agmatine deiminase [Myxococcus stipitatus DSM 14675]|uniref:Agmatine deiminase n=1 Tax=Myxococcus stipitatus (strain DSM 14675 / JCM 12634 / Mx s8) TaxID=1278073 RepID=L7U7B1_MYXSD|nr:agmatine deiminase family protein [Myxococcus stipitatus]AGC43432.1 Agmatine deiminase [Myxococcus stipitatus DSM 14675]
MRGRHMLGAGVVVMLVLAAGCSSQPSSPQREEQEVAAMYTLPDPLGPHEGTWLAWPHHYEYGKDYRDGLDPTWVAMTRALVDSENVHVLAYNEQEVSRIRALLTEQGVPLDRVDFTVHAFEDVWIRDFGPIYVRDSSGALVIEGWGFNGWGEKENFVLSAEVPKAIANKQSLPFVDLQQDIVNEGGSVEIDATGTLMATRSSTLNPNRNPEMTQAQMEGYFRKYLGVTRFIWLDGVAGLDITDMHIDGFAVFAHDNTLVTMSDDDLSEWGVPDQDIDTLHAAKNAEGQPYTLVTLPLTAKNVTTTWGKQLGYKGSYANYYVANSVVLVPNYADANDSAANAIIQKLFPEKKVVGIDVRNLYAEGGMVHCVTQQQPR